MTQRMSASEYNAMLASGAFARSSGRMLRLPADYVPKCRVAEPVLAPKSAEDESPRQKKISSAQRARDRVIKVIEALESARTDVSFTVDGNGRQRVLIRIVGGETLPPNRAANIGREQSKLSQRAFSRYKHACADRMRDAAMQLQAQAVAAGVKRFNAQCLRVSVSYGRQVTSNSRCIDEDAVGYSFKYLLDGLVQASVLVDDSRKYIRQKEHIQRVSTESVLLIELVADPSDVFND